jgi:hypothetical protein
VSVSAGVGETGVRLIARMTENGAPFRIESGSYAVFSAVKPDGNPIFNDCMIFGNDTVVYDFSEQTVSAPGIVRCQIFVFAPDGTLILSPRFQIVVHENVYGKEIESTLEYSAIKKFVEEINVVNSALNTHGERLSGLDEMLDGFDREQGSVIKYVDDVASRSGIYVGSGEMPENCILQIILDEPDDPEEPDVPEVPDEPDEPDVPEGATQYNVEYKYYDTDQNVTSTSIVGKVTAGDPLNKTIYGKMGHTTERITVQMGEQTATVARGETKNNGIITCYLDADGSEGGVIISAVTSDVVVSIVTAKIEG